MLGRRCWGDAAGEAASVKRGDHALQVFGVGGGVVQRRDGHGAGVKRGDHALQVFGVGVGVLGYRTIGWELRASRCCRGRRAGH